MKLALDFKQSVQNDVCQHFANNLLEFPKFASNYFPSYSRVGQLKVAPLHLTQINPNLYQKFHLKLLKVARPSPKFASHPKLRYLLPKF